MSEYECRGCGPDGKCLETCKVCCFCLRELKAVPTFEGAHGPEVRKMVAALIRARYEGEAAPDTEYASDFEAVPGPGELTEENVGAVPTSYLLTIFVTVATSARTRRLSDVEAFTLGLVSQEFDRRVPPRKNPEPAG